MSPDSRWLRRYIDKSDSGLASLALDQPSRLLFMVTERDFRYWDTYSSAIRFSCDIANFVILSDGLRCGPLLIFLETAALFLASPATAAATGSKWSRGSKEPSLLWMQFCHFSGPNRRLSSSIIVVGCCGSRINQERSHLCLLALPHPQRNLYRGFSIVHFEKIAHWLQIN